MITVFTPAYNRAHLLPRLYESLCKQTYRDFEWLIVDDGSGDETVFSLYRIPIDEKESVRPNDTWMMRNLSIYDYTKTKE